MGVSVMKRIKSGIEGIDGITNGFPMGRSMLVTGDAGSGKTIFGLQFARSSCIQGYKTVYITTEEDASDLYTQGDTFNWDLKSYTENGLLSFNELAGNTQTVIIDNIGSYTAKLTPYEFRDRFDLLIYDLKIRDITALVILDSATSNEFNEIALFSVYGALRLMKRENPYTGRRERVMDIMKMRSTKTPTQFISYEINSNGISVI